MAADREDREQIRCSNGECPSRHGRDGARIVVERGIKTGWYYKKLPKGELSMLMPVTCPCDSCGQTWINPGLMLFDGVTEVLGRIAERLAADPVEHPRRRLRGAA